MTNAFSQAISMGMSQQCSGMGLYSQSNGMGLNQQGTGMGMSQQGTNMGMNQPGIGNMLNPQQGLGSSSRQGLGMGDLSQTFGEQNQGLPFQGFMPSSQPPPQQVSCLLLLQVLIHAFILRRGCSHPRLCPLSTAALSTTMTIAVSYVTRI